MIQYQSLIFHDNKNIKFHKKLDIILFNYKKQIKYYINIYKDVILKKLSLKVKNTSNLNFKFEKNINWKI